MKNKMKQMMNVMWLMLLMAFGAIAAQAQGLDDPKVFDANFYMGKYPDICAAFQGDAARARQHWLTYGINEGRQGSPTFDAKYYLNAYPDLQQAFGQNYEQAIWHWFAWGINEGRRASREFDSSFYLTNDPDVNAHCQGDRACAIYHWKNHGISEKRTGAADYNYPENQVASCTPRVAPPPPLSVLNYNVMMLAPPLGTNHAQAERAVLIPGAIKKYQPGWDVVVFQEAFSVAQLVLKTGMVEAGYPYATPVVTGQTVSNGGVYIQSRWPIEHYEQIVYSAGSGGDYLASKGAMYARINKNGRIYHIFGTHLQADRGPLEAAVRVIQLRELAQFINRVAAGAAERGEPVIVSGDMNLCIEQDNAEYRNMLATLNATFPNQRPGDWSFDPGANSVAKYRYEGSNPEWLDYVMPSRIGVMPTETDYRVVKLKSISPYAMGGISHTDLSDHYALSAVYGFGVGSVAATIPTAPTTVKYTVTVRTGTDSGAGTSANIHLAIYGPGSGVGFFHLNPTSSFSNGQVVTLEFSAQDIGNVTRIELNSDGSSPAASWWDGSAWQCASVTISKDGATYNVPVNSWIYGGRYSFNVR